MIRYDQPKALLNGASVPTRNPCSADLLERPVFLLTNWPQRHIWFEPIILQLPLTYILHSGNRSYLCYRQGRKCVAQVIVEPFLARFSATVLRSKLIVFFVIKMAHDALHETAE